MQKETSLNRSQFLLRWVFANLLAGFIVGFLEENGMQFAATLFWAGAIVGSLQWVVLRQVMQLVQWWPLVSTVGWIVGSLIATLSGSFYRPIVETLWNHLGLWEVFWLNIITGPIPVLGMAIAQGLVLSQKTRISGRFISLWILASAIAGAVKGGTSAAFCAALCYFLPSILVGIVAGLGWAAYGVLTGLVLLRLFNAGDRPLS
ncbi:MAG: hypothetical protein ACFE0I_06640 [Elainellaceae cyanobacterium]